jgi:hypothetical protein
MKLQLTPSWALSDEHPASSYGQPVLVGKDGTAHGTWDMIQVYPSWPPLLARDAVKRLADTVPGLTRVDHSFLNLFIGGEL